MNLELNLKERNFGGYPQGIIFGFQVLESWLYGGKPEAHLEYGKIFDDLKKKVNEGYFENLIKEVLLENNHILYLILVNPILRHHSFRVSLLLLYLLYFVVMNCFEKSNLSIKLIARK